MHYAVLSLLAATFVAFGVSAGPLVRRQEVQLNPPVESLVAPFVNTTDATKRSFGISNQEVSRRGNPKPGHAKPGHDDAPECVETNTGRIKAFNQDVFLGYVRTTPNAFGEFGLTADETLALTISFEYDPSTPQTPFGLFITNGPLFNVFPLFGAVAGFANTNDDLGPNSYNFAYLVGTSQTPPNSPPMGVANSFTAATALPENAESSIWSYNPQDSVLKPQWVNTDSSKPATFITYTQDTLILTGDATVFSNSIGGTVISPVSLVFVSN